MTEQTKVRLVIQRRTYPLGGEKWTDHSTPLEIDDADRRLIVLRRKYGDDVRLVRYVTTMEVVE